MSRIGRANQATHCREALLRVRGSALQGRGPVFEEIKDKESKNSRSLDKSQQIDRLPFVQILQAEDTIAHVSRLSHLVQLSRFRNQLCCHQARKRTRR